MTLVGVLFVLCLQNIFVENVMISFRYPPDKEESQEDSNNSDDLSKDMEWKDPKTSSLRLTNYENGKNYYDNSFIEVELKELQDTTPHYNDNPCSEVIASDSKNTAVQSLLRKYRYDSKGVLIPNSVKYYVKMPQGFGSTPILVPLMNKAYSPLGGYVRYYKEVPPIPPFL